MDKDRPKKAVCKWVISVPQQFIFQPTKPQEWSKDKIF